MSGTGNCARCGKPFPAVELKPLSSKRIFFLKLGGLGLPTDEQAKCYCGRCRPLLNGGLVFLAFIALGGILILVFARFIHE
jgi:hypothetical protein